MIHKKVGYDDTYRIHIQNGKKGKKEKGKKNVTMYAKVHKRQPTEQQRNSK